MKDETNLTKDLINATLYGLSIGVVTLIFGVFIRRAQNRPILTGPLKRFQ